MDGFYGLDADAGGQIVVNGNIGADEALTHLTINAGDDVTLAAGVAVVVQGNVIINANEGVTLTAGATSLESISGTVVIRADVDGINTGDALFDAGSSISANGVSGGIDVAGQAITFDTLNATGKHGSVKLVASTGAISTDGDADIDITASTIYLEAVTGIGAAGTNNEIDTTVTGSTIEAYTSGDDADIYINNTSTANAELTAWTKGANADITFNQFGVGGATGTLTLEEVTTGKLTGNTGNIVISSAGGNIIATLVTAGGAGNITIDTTSAGDITVGTLTAADDGTPSTTDDTITINSAGGIYDDETGSGEHYTVDLDAYELNLDAVTGIGTGTGMTGNAIETSATIIAADTSGDGPANINIANYLDSGTTLNASTVGANASITFDQYGIAGTTGTLTLQSVVTASGNIDISSEAGVISGIAQAAGSTPTTIELAASASSDDDFYNGRVIKILDHTGVGQTRTITDYDGTTKVATVSAWTTTPDATSVYDIIDSGDITAKTVTAGSAGAISIDTKIAGNVTVGGGSGVTASTGAIAINAASSIMDNSTIQTGGLGTIKLTAGENIQIADTAAATVTAVNGDITVTAVGDITVGNSIGDKAGVVQTTGTGGIEVTTDLGNVTLKDTTAITKIDSGGYIKIDPVNVTIADVGLIAGSYIEIEATGIVTNNSTIFVDTADGHVKIDAGDIVQNGNITTTIDSTPTDYVTLKATVGLIPTGGVSTGTITDTTSGTTDITTTTLNITGATAVGTSSGGPATPDDGWLDTDVKILNIEKVSGSVYVLENDSTSHDGIQLGSAPDKVDVDLATGENFAVYANNATYGDIKVHSVDALAGTVTLTSEYRTISDADNDTATKIKAAAIVLNAVTGIGTVGTAGTGRAIEVDADTVTATNTTSGGIFLNAIGTGGDSITAHAQTAGNIEIYGTEKVTLTDVDTANGTIMVSVNSADIIATAVDGTINSGVAQTVVSLTTNTSGNIEVTHVNGVNSGVGAGNVSIIAAGSVSEPTTADNGVYDVRADNTLTIAAGLSIGGSDAMIEVDAPTLDLTSGSNGIYIEDLHTGGVDVTANSQSTGNIVMTSTEAVTLTDIDTSDTSHGSVTVTVTGNMITATDVVTGDGDVTLTAGTNIIVGLINAAGLDELHGGRVSLTANAGTIVDTGPEDTTIDIIAGDIVLNTHGNNGTIGSVATGALDTHVTGSTITANTTGDNADIHIDNTSTENVLFNAEASGTNSNITFNQDGGGDVLVGVVKALGDTITISNSVSAIEDDETGSGSDGTKDLIARVLDLDAVTGIGTTEEIETAATTIYAHTTGSNANIDLINYLATATELVDVSTTGTNADIKFGQIDGGELTLTSVTTVSGDIAISSKGVNGVSGTGNIIAKTVTAVGAGNAGNISIDTTILGDVRVDTTVATNDGDIEITAAGAVTNNGTITTGGSDNHIEITAEDAITNNNTIYTSGTGSHIAMEVTGINGVITNNEMIRTNSYGSVITIKANSADGKVFNYDTIETLGSSYSDIDIEAAKKVTNDGLIVTEGRRGNIAITVTGADGTVTNSGTIRAQMYDSRIDIAATGIESAVTNEEGATIETLGNNSPIKITTAGSVTNDSMIRTTGLGGDCDITITAGQGATNDVLIGESANATVEADYGNIKITAGGDLLIGNATANVEGYITTAEEDGVGNIKFDIGGDVLMAATTTGGEGNPPGHSKVDAGGWLDIDPVDVVVNDDGLEAVDYITITATGTVTNYTMIKTTGDDSYIDITAIGGVTNSDDATIISQADEGGNIKITSTDGQVLNDVGATIETDGDDSYIEITGNDGVFNNDDAIIIANGDATGGHIKITADDGMVRNHESATIETTGVDSYITVHAGQIMQDGDITTPVGGSEYVTLTATGHNDTAGTITDGTDGTSNVTTTLLTLDALSDIGQADSTGLGRFDTDVDVLAAKSDNGDIIVTEWGTTGFTQGGASNTIILETGASSADDAYNGQQIVILSGTGAGQTRTISNYVGSTRTATVSEDWITPLDSSSVYGHIGSDVELRNIEATNGSIVLECVYGGMTQAHGGDYVITAGGSTLTMIQAESIDLSIFAFDNKENTDLMLSSTGTASGSGLDSGEGAITAVDLDHAGLYKNGAEIDGSYIDGRNYAGGNTDNAADKWLSIQAKATRNIYLQGSSSGGSVRDIVIGTHIGGNPFDAAHTFGDGTLLVGNDSLLDGGRYVIPGTALAGGPSTIQLAAGASTENDFYKGRVIEILDGTGEGQIRTITAYNGATQVATVSEAWATEPVAGSEYGINAIGVLTSTGGGVSVVKSTDGTIRTFGYDTLDYVTITGYSDTMSSDLSLHTGVLLPYIDDYAYLGYAQAGTSTTITLAAIDSTTNDFYNGRQIKIVDGTGKGQIRTIIDYDGTTRVATLSAAWTTNPNGTSEYGIDEYAGRAAIVLVSEREDLKLGLEDLGLNAANIKLNAGGTYGAYSTGPVDDRDAINFEDILYVSSKQPGELFDVAIYLGSYKPGYATGLYNPVAQTGHDVVMNASVYTLAVNAAVVIDAYDTVTFGSAFDASPGFVTGEGQVLEASSRITETVQDAWILGTLPYVDEYADGLLPPGFHGDEYILRGGETEAWVLNFINPVPIPPPLPPVITYVNVGIEPVPPLMFYVPKDHNEVLDCTELKTWTAKELSVQETQVYLAESSLTQSTDTTHRQLCEVCDAVSKLSKTLSDANGTRVAALNAVVEELAPSSKKEELTYAQMVLIVSVLSDHTNDGTRYAAAREWFGAMSAYVNILNKEFGWSRDKAIEFAMHKYASKLMENNPRTATIVWMYLEQ